VIIFDPDIEFIRKLEVHQALHPDQPIRVYFLSYGDSTETQKYERFVPRLLLKSISDSQVLTIFFTVH
jgi:hypothetical protein